MSGGVFISYRREDTAGFAGRIYDHLTTSLGHENVFLDVDNIPPGLDFVEVLSERVGKCDALVAVIGKDWVSSADKGNRRRIDDPHDLVRIEIEAARERNVRVIPVLLEGAAMPRPEDLPESLKKLSRRQAIEISHARFDADVDRLTRALSQLEELRQPKRHGIEVSTVGEQLWFFDLEGSGPARDFKGQRYHARVFHELPRDRRERRAWGMQPFIGRGVQ